MADDAKEWSRLIKEVLPFMLKLKGRMQELNKRRVRVACPNKAHTEQKFVWASLNGKRDHLHFGCEDPDCYYKGME